MRCNPATAWFSSRLQSGSDSTQDRRRWPDSTVTPCSWSVGTWHGSGAEAAASALKARPTTAGARLSCHQSARQSEHWNWLRAFLEKRRPPATPDAARSVSPIRRTLADPHVVQASERGTSRLALAGRARPEARGVGCLPGDPPDEPLCSLVPPGNRHRLSATGGGSCGSRGSALSRFRPPLLSLTRGDHA